MKRIQVFFVMIALSFAFQGSVWAAVAQAEATQTPPDIIALAENPQLAALEQESRPSEAVGMGGIQIQPWFWAFSVLFPGLGQLAMGDIRGLIFFGVTALTIAFFSNLFPPAFLLEGPFAQSPFALLAIALDLTILTLWVMNIFDAYGVNQAKLKEASADLQAQNLQRQELESRIMQVAEFLESHPIAVAKDGSVNTRLASF
ncbi:MAG: hypothetical protein ACAI44_10740 [Candidatus Sericytochromatia bacterium]